MATWKNKCFCLYFVCLYSLLVTSHATHSCLKIACKSTCLVEPGWPWTDSWSRVVRMTLERWDWQQFLRHIYEQSGLGGHHTSCKATWELYLGTVNKQELRGTGFIVTWQWGDSWFPGGRMRSSYLSNCPSWQDTETWNSRISRGLVPMTKKVNWPRELIHWGRMGRGLLRFGLLRPSQFYQMSRWHIIVTLFLGLCHTMSQARALAGRNLGNVILASCLPSLRKAS